MPKPLYFKDWMAQGNTAPRPFLTSLQRLLRHETLQQNERVSNGAQQKTDWLVV